MLTSLTNKENKRLDESPNIAVNSAKLKNQLYSIENVIPKKKAKKDGVIKFK